MLCGAEKRNVFGLTKSGFRVLHPKSTGQFQTLPAKGFIYKQKLYYLLGSGKVGIVILKLDPVHRDAILVGDIGKL